MFIGDPSKDYLNDTPQVPVTGFQIYEINLLINGYLWSIIKKHSAYGNHIKS